MPSMIEMGSVKISTLPLIGEYSLPPLVRLVSVRVRVTVSQSEAEYRAGLDKT